MSVIPPTMVRSWHRIRYKCKQHSAFTARAEDRNELSDLSLEHDHSHVPVRLCFIILGYCTVFKISNTPPKTLT